MNRRQFLQQAGMSAAGLYLGVGAIMADDQIKQAKPNIVMFLADDHGRADYGFAGEKNIRTPNIDKLAGQGMVLTRAFTPTAMCAPSRSSCYTGLYPMRHGCYMNHGDSKQDIKSLAHYLKPLGYDVVLVGKRHINPESTYPFEYVGFNNKGSLPVKKVDQILKRNKPVCLIFASHEPHEPHQSGLYKASQVTVPPNMYPSDATKSKRADYWTDCELEDREVGQLMQLVADSGKSDNTLLIYSSDHGYSTMAKWTCYDAGLNVAMIARWPGRIAPGSSSDALVSFVDLVPTFIQAAGGRPPADLDGKSMLGVLEGKVKGHHEYIYGLHTNQGILNGKPYPVRSVRDSRYHYIRNLNPDGVATNVQNHLADGSVRPGGDLASWQAAAKTDPKAQAAVDRFIHRPAEELYDTQSDPWELKNLASDPAMAEIKNRLSAELERWMKAHGDNGMADEMKVHSKSRK